MICKNCNNYMYIILSDYYSLFNENLEVKEIYEENIDIVESDSQICKCCGTQIFVNESFVYDADSYIDGLVEYWAGEVKNQIATCNECGDGQDIQSLKVSMKSHFGKNSNYEEAFEKVNTATDLGDLISDSLGSQFYHLIDKIAAEVECPNCDNGSGVDMSEHIDNGEFDADTEVYTQNDIDRFNYKFYGDTLDDFEHEVLEITKNLSMDELILLKENYMLDTMTKENEQSILKLENLIRGVYKFKSTVKPYALSKNKMLFRARINASKIEYPESKLWNPPKGKSSAGRYNKEGDSILYCSNNMDVLSHEINAKKEDVLNFASFIVDGDLKLFPINLLFKGNYNGLVNEKVTKVGDGQEDKDDVKTKHEYILCNIISVIVAKTGFNGIVYTSTKDELSLNFALINFEKNKNIKFVQSYFGGKVER